MSTAVPLVKPLPVPVVKELHGEEALRMWLAAQSTQLREHYDRSFTARRMRRTGSTSTKSAVTITAS
jgi:hypothetical protein